MPDDPENKPVKSLLERCEEMSRARWAKWQDPEWAKRELAEIARMSPGAPWAQRARRAFASPDERATSSSESAPSNNDDEFLSAETASKE